MALLWSLVGAALVTLQIAGLAAVLAVTVGALAGVARMSGHRVVRLAAGFYVELFRGTSALVQLFYAYYVLPLVGLTLPAFPTAVIVLGLNIGSYGAELVRGAIQAVPEVQREAGVALGMSPFLLLRRVIFPQALLAMVPPWTNLLIDLIKTTAFVSLIGVTELTFRAQLLREQTGGRDVIPVFAVVIALYLIMAQAVSVGGRVLERRLSRGRDVGRKATRLMS